ncbi:MAG: heavy-metal-associated domain-containing protein [Bacteroidetes bacterium]|nr:heavy-metal-associated domain-containing protein [Bacteroidota bacterium]
MKKLFVLFIVFAFVSCQSGSKKQATESIEVIKVVEATVNIGGMHCDMCVASIEKGIKELEGITLVTVSLGDSTAIVKFDASKADLTKIEKAIEKRGYSIKEDI